MANFTVNIVTFPAFEGVDFTIENPTATLLLVPNQGYTLTASNFTATNPLPSYVNSVLFTQAGLNVTCVITYNSPSIMPGADVFIDVCSSGFAEESLITVSGSVIDCGISNVSQPGVGVLPLAYNGSGVFGSNSTVITQTVAADTGYYFESAPVLSLSIGNLSNYTITNVKTYNASNQLIQVVFTVTYTFPAKSIAGDEFCLTANAFEIYSPSIEILSYSFDTAPVDGGTTTRSFTINGIEGAQWALTANYTPGNINIVNTSGTIDSTGLAVVTVIFPAATVNRVYTFTLTGDLASSFDTTGGQLSVFAVNQYLESTLSFVFSSSASHVTVGAADVRTYLPYSNSQTHQYTVEATSNQNFAFDIEPPLSGWSNQSLASPNGDNYVQSVNTQSIAVDNLSSPKTLVATLSVTVGFAGVVDMISTLNLDSYLSGSLMPITLTYSLTDACCDGISSTYFINNGETFLTATSILDASGSPAADGFYRQ